MISEWISLRVSNRVELCEGTYVSHFLLTISKCSFGNGLDTDMLCLIRLRINSLRYTENHQSQHYSLDIIRVVKIYYKIYTVQAKILIKQQITFVNTSNTDTTINFYPSIALSSCMAASRTMTFIKIPQHHGSLSYSLRRLYLSF